MQVAPKQVSSSLRLSYTNSEFSQTCSNIFFHCKLLGTLPSKFSSSLGLSQLQFRVPSDSLRHFFSVRVAGYSPNQVASLPGLVWTNSESPQTCSDNFFRCRLLGTLLSNLPVPWDSPQFKFPVFPDPLQCIFSVRVAGYSLRASHQFLGTFMYQF